MSEISDLFGQPKALRTPKKLTQEIVNQIKLQISRGLTMLEVCEIIGISRMTYHRWKETALLDQQDGKDTVHTQLFEGLSWASSVAKSNHLQSIATARRRVPDIDEETGQQRILDGKRLTRYETPAEAEARVRHSSRFLATRTNESRLLRADESVTLGVMFDLIRDLWGDDYLAELWEAYTERYEAQDED
jgi:hypothetical protein